MQLPLHRVLKCRARTRSGQPCQARAMPNGRCRMHGGTSPGAPKGNKNASSTDRYTAEEIANRREITALLGTVRALARATRELAKRWIVERTFACSPAHAAVSSAVSASSSCAEIIVTPRFRPFFRQFSNQESTHQTT
jgi:hypothetical protein